MKKKLLFSFLLLIALVIVVGCNKKEEEKEKSLLGGWELLLTDKQVTIPEEVTKVFDAATKDYVGMDFEPVALLGTQIVAGTNYMFLCKGKPVVPNPETSYKIVVVYENLEGKSSIIHANDFDFVKYVNKNSINKYEELSGGWAVSMPEQGVKLEDKVQTAFDNASKKIQDAKYLPIGVLGKQLVSGTNYALLAYGSINNVNGIYLLTLYEDLNGTQEIVASSYVDLAEYNK